MTYTNKIGLDTLCHIHRVVDRIAVFNGACIALSDPANPLVIHLCREPHDRWIEWERLMKPAMVDDLPVVGAALLDPGLSDCRTILVAAECGDAVPHIVNFTADVIRGDVDDVGLRGRVLGLPFNPSAEPVPSFAEASTVEHSPYRLGELLRARLQDANRLALSTIQKLIPKHIMSMDVWAVTPKEDERRCKLCGARLLAYPWMPTCRCTDAVKLNMELAKARREDLHGPAHSPDGAEQYEWLVEHMAANGREVTGNKAQAEV